MREVPLSGSGAHIALVDDADFELVCGHRWYALKVKRSKTIYARAHIGGHTVYMHRLIMGEPVGLDVDHLDFNGLNNQRANLQAVTHQQNIFQGLIRQDIAAWRARRDARRADVLLTRGKPPKGGES